MSVQFEPMKPYADGILYDDMWLIRNRDVRAKLIARGLAWGTTFKVGATDYAGCILAGTLRQAEQIAFGRGLGETIDGPYIEPQDWPWLG